MIDYRSELRLPPATTAEAPKQPRPEARVVKVTVVVDPKATKEPDSGSRTKG